MLNRRLAVGGMGDVWLAKNETTDALVALKIMRPSGNDQRTHARERFRREAKLGGLLSHRNIVRIFDFLEEPDQTLVLVMELLRGDSLDHYIQRRGGLEAREALAIMVPVLSALQHGHDHGIVHRDVKPANVYLAVDPDGHVTPKLLDFGIAKMPNNGKKTIDGVVLGTPSYMSPEQINAEPMAGTSDLFSAGVMLYELLTGTCPFEAPTPAAAIAAVLMNEVDPDPRIDPKLWIEIQRSLKKRPMERHKSASEMADALCAAIGETEDSLLSAMRRSSPPSLRPLSEPAPTMAVPDGYTQNVAGQSVVTIIPRRGAKNAIVAIVALVASVVAIVAVTAIRASRPSDVRTSAAMVSPVSVPSASIAAPSGSAGASAAAASGAASSDIELDDGAPSANGSARAGATNATTTHATPRHATRPSKPKPIATSPGF